MYEKNWKQKLQKHHCWASPYSSKNKNKSLALELQTVAINQSEKGLRMSL
jgi:hypothetical protein